MKADDSLANFKVNTKFNAFDGYASVDDPSIGSAEFEHVPRRGSAREREAFSRVKNWRLVGLKESSVGPSAVSEPTIVVSPATSTGNGERVDYGIRARVPS